jgi:hypothetical protein
VVKCEKKEEEEGSGRLTMTLRFRRPKEQISKIKNPARMELSAFLLAAREKDKDKGEKKTLRSSKSKQQPSPKLGTFFSSFGIASFLFCSYYKSSPPRLLFF